MPQGPETIRPRLSCEWLHACSGCEIALINLGERLLPLLDQVELVHFPLVMDNKQIAAGEGGGIRLPEADIGLVSGAVAHDEHLEVLRAMRRSCRFLIALGTCASHGGIPAMMNQWPMAEGMRAVFAPGDGAAAGMPAFLERVCSLDEQVRVDLALPGCPPAPELIGQVIEALVKKEELRLPHKSVCEHCPTVREGRVAAKSVRRFLANADYDPAQPVDQMRCLLEQGLLCLGPVTAGGCGGRGTPLCLRARVPCRGCYGPVRAGGNQLLEMMNGLAGKGLDHRGIVDRKSLLRFSGAHGLLRPARKGR